jgi:hypothetical protein
MTGGIGASGTGMGADSTCAQGRVSRRWPISFVRRFQWALSDAGAGGAGKEKEGSLRLPARYSSLNNRSNPASLVREDHQNYRLG